MSELDNLIKAMEQAKALREQNETANGLLEYLHSLVGPYSKSKSHDADVMQLVRSCLKTHFNFDDGK